MTTYAYEWTVIPEVWEQTHTDVNLQPYLIREAQKKAGTAEGEWTVSAFLDMAVMADGLEPVYRVCVEGRVP